METVAGSRPVAVTTSSGPGRETSTRTATETRPTLNGLNARFSLDAIAPAFSVRITAGAD
jgi:hypothetical protein